MHTINLSTRELQVVLAALQAVAPIGGGSEQYSLYCKLSGETLVETPPELIGDLQITAYREYRDYLAEQQEG